MGKVIHSKHKRWKHPRKKGVQEQTQRFRKCQQQMADLDEQIHEAMGAGEFVRAEQLARSLEALAVQKNVAGGKRAHQYILSAMEGQTQHATDAHSAAAGLLGYLESTLNSLQGELAELEESKKSLEDLDSDGLAEWFGNNLKVPDTPSTRKASAKINEIVNEIMPPASEE